METFFGSKKLWENTLGEKRSWHFWEAKKKNTVQWFFPTNINSAVPGLHASVSNFHSPPVFTGEFYMWILSLPGRHRNCVVLPQPECPFANRRWAESTWVWTTTLCVACWIMCIASNAACSWDASPRQKGGIKDGLFSEPGWEEGAVILTAATLECFLLAPPPQIPDWCSIQNQPYLVLQRKLRKIWLHMLMLQLAGVRNAISADR